MGANTKIEWADHSWSPWRGCTKVSPGCANCYAETLSKRNPAVLGNWGKGKPRVLAKNWGDPIRWNARVATVHCENAIGDKFTVTVRRPRIFPSLCDWLDAEVPIEWLARFLALIYDTPNLDWLLLTKRPENWPLVRMALTHVLSSPDESSFTNEFTFWLQDWCDGHPPKNVWFGVSVEDQQRADERIPKLLEIPARVRWLSVEPLLGPVNLGLSPSVRCPHCDNYVPGHATGGHDICDCRIDWVVVGGESGPKARPCNVQWIRDIVGQCRTAKVPCFVKQVGAFPIHDLRREGFPMKVRLQDPKGGDQSEWPEDLRVRQYPQ